MLLELTVVSYHRLSSRQEAIKTFDQFGGTIGRSESSDWYLPDPERVVSGTHARIEERNGSFYITDLSTNGLYVNRSVEPLGTDNSHLLSDGDFLSLGEYEVEVRLVTQSSNNAVPESSASDQLLNNYQTEVIPSSTQSSADLGMGIPMSEFARPQSSSSTPVVATIESIQSVDATSVSDTLDDHFLPPSPQIPEEWDSHFAPIDPIPPSTPQVPESTPMATNTAVNATHVGSTPVQNPPVSEGSSVDEQHIVALLRGMGISSDMIPAHADDKWWEQLGGTFQELLLGLMDVLRNRSTTKSEFRVNQTTFQQKENNPLKFSASLEDAFHNLFNRPGTSFLPAQQAVKDAYQDINRHEEAIMAGAKGAVNGVLNQLSPELVQSKDFTTSFMDKMTPAKRQARYWDIYKELYKDLQKDFSNEGERAVNDEFTAAYEAALKK
ncbi:type VI secretion system-associated FHA domain protein TagH [Litoribrevibacter albus]|uniref:FHA domain-containing protein n=1 Tax=Litoribrevibacter albus TaxID=1473156 RepID=A0AA37W852_9GAMM|nr:type VI secretion system-associated FHA domain protein TagH [Litoribrevibacter albus]GLQ31844.1 FHA domain-containing protein [Litoribrevibacter albus]